MVMNLYYTALPVGMCTFPPSEIPGRQFLLLSPFFPHVGDRWRRVKRSTTRSRLGLARLELCLLSNLQSFPKGDQQLWRYQNSSQPNRMKSIFLAESCWLPIDCEPAACCSVFWTKIGHETCIMSNLVEIYWRHVRDFFQLCWFILWKLLKHWPNISGFHPFFYSKDSKGEIWFIQIQHCLKGFIQDVFPSGAYLKIGPPSSLRGRWGRHQDAGKIQLQQKTMLTSEDSIGGCQT